MKLVSGRADEMDASSGAPHLEADEARGQEVIPRLSLRCRRPRSSNGLNNGGQKTRSRLFARGIADGPPGAAGSGSGEWQKGLDRFGGSPTVGRPIPYPEGRSIPRPSHVSRPRAYVIRRRVTTLVALVAGAAMLAGVVVVALAPREAPARPEAVASSEPLVVEGGPSPARRTGTRPAGVLAPVRVVRPAPTVVISATDTAGKLARLDTAFRMTFDRVMDVASVQAALRVTASGTETKSTALAGKVTASVVEGRTIATFTPAAPLAPDTLPLTHLTQTGSPPVDQVPRG